MNVFDFDGTLYRGDSTVDFWRYACIRYPRCLCALPQQTIATFFFVTKRINKSAFKEQFYSFLRYLPNTAQTVKDFWKVKQSNLRADVLSRASKNDLVISASPTFLLEEICSQYGWKLIASKVDSETGTLLSPNCYGEEKVSRIRATGFEGYFDQGYTDSLSDKPLMRLAQKPFLVKKHNIVPFPIDG